MEAVGKIYLNQPSRSTVWSLYNLSDIHLGNKACAKGRLLKDIKEIKSNKYARWFATGDLGEYISHSDKRHDFGALDPEIFDTPDKLGNIGKTVHDVLMDLLSPIKDKCLGVGIGNHEWSYSVRENQESLQRALSIALGVPYLGYTAFMDTVFCRLEHDKVSIRHLLTHGSGGSATPGGKINRLVKYTYMFDADVYWVGHMHDDIHKIVPLIKADVKCKEVIHAYKVAVLSGSYFRTYVQGAISYGEQKGYAPTFLGPSRVDIEPFHFYKDNEGKERTKPIITVKTEVEM